MADKKKIPNGSIHISIEDEEQFNDLNVTISRNKASKYLERKNQKCQTINPINNLITREAYNMMKIHQRSISNISFNEQSQNFAIERDNNLRPYIQNIRKNMKLQNSLCSNSSQSTFYNSKTENLKDLIIELVSENIKIKRKYKNYKENKKEPIYQPCKNLSLYSFVKDFKTGSHLRINRVDRRKNKLN